MREEVRQPAIAAYRFYAGYYALLGLLGRVQAVLSTGQTGAVRRLLTTSSDDPRWEHQRGLLTGPLAVPDVLTGLRQLPAVLDTVAREVERSKAKDDRRGPGIIDDYREAHTPAAQDRLVRQTWEETRQLQDEVTRLLRLLEPGQAPPESVSPQPHDLIGSAAAGFPAGAELVPAPVLSAEPCS
jgi:hypothetical protein